MKTLVIATGCHSMFLHYLLNPFPGSEASDMIGQKLR